MVPSEESQLEQVSERNVREKVEDKEDLANDRPCIPEGFQ